AGKEAASMTVAWLALAPGDQNRTVGKQSGRMVVADPRHIASGSEGSGSRIVEFSACKASTILVRAADKQDLSVPEQGRCTAKDFTRMSSETESSETEAGRRHHSRQTER